MNSDVYVYFVDLPAGIREAVRPCIDGYTVYINRRLADEEAIKAYDHAIKHIRNGDFDQIGEVQEVECKAHGD